MFEKEIGGLANHSGFGKICMTMDLVENYYKDYSDAIKSRVNNAMHNFFLQAKEFYSAEDATVMPYYEQLIDAFYKAIIKYEPNCREYGNKVYFVDFIGKFNMTIYEHTSYYIEYKNHVGSDGKTIVDRDRVVETVCDLFGKKIADFIRPYHNGVGAHVFLNKTNCDIFCKFVETLNNNVLN